jgi:uncharacterized protein YfdQ (DUF2303 family)
MQPRTIFAEPCRGFGNASWLNALVDLLVFERLHTQDHPTYGRVVAVETADEQRQWQQLIDAEAAAYNGMLTPDLITDHPIPASHELTPTES